MGNWRYILWTVGCLAALTACSSDDESPDPYDGAIRFDNRTEEEFALYSPRGTEVGNDNLAEFGVFAYYLANSGGRYNEATSVPNYMENVQVTRDLPAGAWSYTPVMYWPAEGTLSFFAYTPYDTGTAPDDGLTVTCTTGAPVVAYTVPDDVSVHRDLMLSAPVLDRPKTTEPVLLNFHHALACITFEACTNAPLADGESIKVTELSIGNFKNKASCTHKEMTSITCSLAPDSEEKAYTLSPAGSTLQNISLNETSRPIVTRTGNIMVWPQEVEVADKLTVKAEYVTSHGIKISKTIEKTLNPDILTTLQSGNRYVLKLQFNAFGDITLTCKVVPWDNKTIEVPKFD